MSGSLQVTYTNAYPWNRSNPLAPQKNRPYAEVIVQGSQASPRIWCLVDSGADHIQLNRSVAGSAGIATTSTITVSTAAGGSATLDVANSVTFSVEGRSVTGRCYFGSNTVPILGRVSFLNAFANVGFGTKDWMHT